MAGRLSACSISPTMCRTTSPRRRSARTSSSTSTARRSRCASPSSMPRPARRSRARPSTSGTATRPASTPGSGARVPAGRRGERRVVPRRGARPGRDWGIWSWQCRTHGQAHVPTRRPTDRRSGGVRVRHDLPRLVSGPHGPHPRQGASRRHGRPHRPTLLRGQPHRSGLPDRRLQSACRRA